MTLLWAEAWSPPEALERCGVTDNGNNEEENPWNTNTWLWNSMISPLTKVGCGWWRQVT